MTHRSPLPAYLLLVLAILACALPGQGNPPAATAPAADSAGAGITPTPDREPPPPPSDFAAVLDAEVAAGAIGYEDGLIRLLRSFLGDPEISLPAAYDNVVTREGNGIVERAGDYIAAGTDEAAKAEMQRLLDLIVPSTEQLEAYSQTAEVNLGGPGLTRPVAQVDCAALWLAGFPLEGVSTYPCFEYTRTEVPGVATYTVYFPAAWVGNPTYSPWFEQANAAANESLQVLGRYGGFDDVSLIFSFLPGARANYLATTHDYEGTRRETCPILIYPIALTLSEGEFKQTVAHEIFHCYQFRNLEGQMMVPQATRRWWSESSAEYFSNVVYPEFDYEFGWIDTFDFNSETVPIYRMGYENFGLMQFLANEWGNPGLIRFLGTLPTSGNADDQRDRLASAEGIEDLFHEFGKDYLDSFITDTGGSMIPFSPTLGPTVDIPQDHFFREFNPQAFVLDRRQLIFAEDTRFEVLGETVGTVGRDSANLALAARAWAPLPTTVDSACGEDHYVLLLTNVQPSGGPTMLYELETTGEELEDGHECESCLLGTWTLDNASAFRRASTESASASPGFAGTGVEVAPSAVFGVMQLTFLQDGTARGVLEGWGETSLAVGPDGSFETGVTYAGSGRAQWRVDTDESTDQRYVYFEAGEFDLVAEVSNQGIPVVSRPMDESNASFFLSSPQQFVCTASVLTYFPDDPLGPIVFLRDGPPALITP